MKDGGGHGSDSRDFFRNPKTGKLWGEEKVGGGSGSQFSVPEHPDHSNVRAQKSTSNLDFFRNPATGKMWGDK